MRAGLVCYNYLSNNQKTQNFNMENKYFYKITLESMLRTPLDEAWLFHGSKNILPPAPEIKS